MAPASIHGSGSVPGGWSTTISKSSPAPSSRTAATISASCAGSSMSIGKRPSQRAARRSGALFGQRPATQTGMRGLCTGGGSNSPAQ